MMAVQIQSFRRVVPMIYAYNTPGIPYHDGWTKVGYTERQSVEHRIAQQTHTANIRWELAWTDNAIFKDGSGEYFTDRHFHDYLEQIDVEREPGTEWFHADGDALLIHFNRFATRKQAVAAERRDYTLRAEQAEAVRMTAAYFHGGGSKFLWNAKPRFGKTLTAYDLVRRMKLTNVLVVTNRPSIANSWADDFRTFFGWRDHYFFVSDTAALAGKPGVLSRAQYMNRLDDEDDAPACMAAFESLQGLKGSIYFGGEHDKLKWISDLTFDLLIVDEAQEGVDTFRTDRAFEFINRKYTLYLSGTPFKALASDQFTSEQIFNWSYADEQAAKETWEGEEYNPYECLPHMAMYTYRLSPMIAEEAARGIDLSGEDERIDYAFDLNEFFATNEAKRFVHEEEVKKFLRALVTNEKYPYSTQELRDELCHTLWLLNRVASAKALAKLLKEDPVFCDYEVVLAAGDGIIASDDESAAAFDRVKAAIRDHDKTITLSVGQLTVGVTIPEWSGVLMLCNLQSPSSYMQAAFRAQNPCAMTKNGSRLRKETAYVFDFDPARTLIIFDAFANNLSPRTADGGGTSDDRKENIRRLLNFFPVLGEDDEGRMVELDAAQVLSIPRKLKSEEVVRSGFMSNFLFQKIANVFGAPGIVKEIVEKLAPAQEEPKRKGQVGLERLSEVSVDADGAVEVPGEIVIGKTQDIFGKKIYEEIEAQLSTEMEEIADTASDYAAVNQSVDRLAEAMKAQLKERVVAPLADAYTVKKGALKKVERQVESDVERSIDRIRADYNRKTNIVTAQLNEKRRTAETQAETDAADAAYHAGIEEALQEFKDAVQTVVQETIAQKPQELVERMERDKAEAVKKAAEDRVRVHLRGFARTIPSFIMAYGDENLTLQNIDDYTEDDVFAEVTGITEEDFRFLRDGGDYVNPETGETERFAGHLFDETVFNDAVREFLKKKEELADYFDETQTEDIFDYIPPQKTNQIFTPRRVVVQMADALEENNPGCFDNPEATFADLYMKSGLYITEVVKRLFRSQRMKELYPDDKARIRHILQHQVYGMAPTRIIYLIATNYILGFDKMLKDETQHFVEADAAQASKEGKLADLVEKCFG
ncbi:type III restriction enzyme, res subunit [Selenomonas sp. oral taxon 137 str. F0430]|nr:type III restriction enzyme, res subunit [Selenomonas sp. oral taxon 137 str. F0430]